MSDKRYQEEYLRRIHKVQDYIEQHTGRALTVEELSNVAGFSMFHFSRIFQASLFLVQPDYHHGFPLPSPT